MRQDFSSNNDGGSAGSKSNTQKPICAFKQIHVQYSFQGSLSHQDMNTFGTNSKYIIVFITKIF